MTTDADAKMEIAEAAFARHGSIGKLAEALSKAQGEMAGAKKDSANPFFKSSYADLASVWDACRAPLAKHGLAVIQKPSCLFIGEPKAYTWVSKNGEEREGVRVPTEVRVTTMLVHSSGQYVEDVLSCMLADADPQKVGSAITYLRRYALQAIVGIAPEDDDAETATGRAASEYDQAGERYQTSAIKGPDVACPTCGKRAIISKWPKRGQSHYCGSCKKGFDPSADEPGAAEAAELFK